MKSPFTNPDIMTAKINLNKFGYKVSMEVFFNFFLDPNIELVFLN